MGGRVCGSDPIFPATCGARSARILCHVETSRIAALLQPFLEAPLASAQLDSISTYIDLLLRWNSRVNLTAIRNPDEIVTRHFGESFFLARHLFPSPSSGVPAERTRVLDIGSGAGFPGLPLKMWAPTIDLTLIESNHKKAAFLREVCRVLTLTNVNVKNERAENLVLTIPPVDVVTFRAVERFDTILPVAARFLAPGGRLAILVGSSQLAALAVLAPSLSWLPPVALPGSESRVLVISEVQSGKQ